MEEKLLVSDVYSVHEIDWGLGQRYRGRPLAGSRVEAGFPSPAEDFLDRPLDLNEYLIGNPAATFFVRVSGDSMRGAGIHHSDILIVDRSLDAEEGSVVIAVVDGDMVVKRLRRLGGRVQLVAENPNYPPIELSEGQDCTVWGVVTYVIHPV